MAVFVFDVETTGFNAREERVIEFGGVAFDDQGEVIGKIGQLINPKKQIPYRVTEITGITQKMVETKGVLWEEFAPRVKPWLERAPIWVGQNLDFDIRFVTEEFRRLGEDLERKPWIDTLLVARRYIPIETLKSKTLSNLASFYGVSLNHAHRAVDDAEATGHLLFEMAKELEMTIDDLVRSEVKILGKRLWGCDPFEAPFLGNAVKHG